MIKQQSRAVHLSGLKRIDTTEFLKLATLGEQIQKTTNWRQSWVWRKKAARRCEN